MNKKLYRLESISEHRGEAIVRDTETRTRSVISTAKYHRDKRKAYTTGQLVKMLNIDRSRLVTWLNWVEYPYYKIVYAENTGNPVSDTQYTKYYSKEDVINIYDMLVRLKTKGRVTKDKFKDPYYNLPSKPELLAKLNDTDVYYMLRDGEYVPVFRPEWT